MKADKSAAMTLENLATGLKLTLTTVDAKVVDDDLWELYFDFRPLGRRSHLYEPGIFQLSIHARNGQLQQKKSYCTDVASSKAIPKVNLQGGSVTGGSKVVLNIPWKEIQKITGRKPTEFAFSAKYTATDGVHKEPRIVAHHFIDPTAKTINAGRLFSPQSAGTYNDGWTIFLLTEKAVPQVKAKVDGKISDLPEWSRLPARKPERNPGELKRRKAEKKRRPDPEMGQRIHPILGKSSTLTYSRAYGCGGVISSCTMDFFRSSTIAFYDYADDSGLRNFSAAKPSCRHPGNILPALGIVLIPDGSSGCSCSYNFQTSLAMAPAASRSNEDWAAFYDRMPSGDIKEIAINFGAPGDRRETESTVWFGFPRKAQMDIVNKPYALELPISLISDKQLGPYYMNANRTKFGNTDRPWIYGSGYRGVQKIFVSLKNYNMNTEALSVSTRVSPKIDGLLTEACWNESFRMPLPKNNGVLYLRHDEKNLYAAAVFSKDSENDNPVSWLRNKKVNDSPVWEDDCLEMFFSSQDKKDEKFIHLAVSASGVRYDGLVEGLKSAKKDYSIKTWNAIVKKEDAKWTAEWKSAITIVGNVFSVEVAIPWTSFEKMGWSKDMLAVNVRNRVPLMFQFYKPASLAQTMVLLDGEKLKTTKRYTVRLHFSEPDNVLPGRRVFDVKMQGKTVLEDFDIVKEAGEKHTALVKEFKNIEAVDMLELEMIPKSSGAGATTMPVISAMEVIVE